MTTRLVWVILFAVLIGAIVLFSLKSLPAARVTRQVAEAEQVRAVLSRMFPDSRFRVQFSIPNPRIHNLVVTIQPGQADSTAIASQVDSAEAVMRRGVDLNGYDSLVVAVFDRVYRTVPAR
ncbi:MAG TPA: hypothetical protein VMH22_01625 [bacterium]|nr:hypothetical protein [bacterium]